MMKAYKEIMTQTRKMSAVETVASTAIGFGVALATQRVVFPLFGIIVPVEHDMLIASIFTTVSIIRGYVVRRVFNAWG